MNHDPLQQLLRSADRTVDAPDPRELAGRVLEKSRQKTIRTMTGSLSIAILVIGLVFIHQWSAHKQQFTESNRISSVAESQRELADLDRQIATQQKLVDRLLADERIRQAQAVLAHQSMQDDPTERAAAAVVFQTDQAFKVAGLKAPALSAYDQVIDCFPNTFSAEIARKRAAELRKEG